VQFWNAVAPILAVIVVKSIAVRELQSRNALAFIVVTELGKVIVSRELQPEKVVVSVVTPAGTMISSKELQFLNVALSVAPASICAVGIETDSSDVQPSNADVPKVVTYGSDIDLRNLHP
jgi:hypothetical protein